MDAIIVQSIFSILLLSSGSVLDPKWCYSYISVKEVFIPVSLSYRPVCIVSCFFHIWCTCLICIFSKVDSCVCINWPALRGYLTT